MRQIRKAIRGYEVDAVEDELKAIQYRHSQHVKLLNDELTHLRADNEILSYEIQSKEVVEFEVPLSAFSNNDGPFLSNAAQQMLNTYKEQTMIIGQLQKKIEALHGEHKEQVAEKEIGRLEALATLQARFRETIKNL